MTVRRAVSARPWWMLLIVAVWFLGGPASTAASHAVVEGTSPADQSVLPSPPDRVSVTFSEAVRITSASLRVYDRTGERVDGGDVRLGDDTRTVSVGVRGDAGRGSFVAAWKVVSDDSHPIHGGFVYSVGEPTHVAGLDRLVASGDDAVWVVAGQVLRTLALLGAVIAVAGAVYGAFLAADRSRVGRVRWPVALGALTTTLAGVAQVPQSAALATGLGPGSLSTPGVAAQVLGAGVAWSLVTSIVAATSAAAAIWVGRDRVLTFVAPAAVSLLAASFALSGHSRTTSPEVLAAAVVVAHGIAAILWVGLVVHVTWSLRGDGPLDGAAREVLRLSRVATVALAVVGVSGLVLAFQHVGSVEGLTSTTYGRLVAVKAVLVAAVAAAGAFNHFQIVPRLRSGKANRSVWRHLGRTLRFEAVMLTVVVAVTAILVSVVPARNVVDASRIVTVSTTLASGTVNVVVDPASTGPVTMHLYLLDAQGRVDDRPLGVTMRARLATTGDQDLARKDMRRVGPGHYQVDGTLFPIAGSWQVNFEVRTGTFDIREADVTIPVRSAG